MSPEERARAIAADYMVCTCFAPSPSPDGRGPLKDGSHYANCPTDDAALLAKDIAAAIRAAVAEEREANKRATVDAVRAERERCAKVAERSADEADSYTTHMALRQFAAAIREEPT